ncbi:hypothetical protein HA402_011646 [Bradysia odoriphaga]|nr:hypothetical protein HA402_011646 [Bradysia odoriphaga]
MFRLVAILILLCTSITNAKILDRCELAKLLKNADITGDNLYKWVCIGQQVGLDTARNYLSPSGVGSYGIFQISDEYWCDAKGSGKMCEISCRKLMDDDLRDDIMCALKIYNEHKQRTGDGFSAWIPWMPECKNADMNYLRECYLGNSDILSIDVRFGDDDDNRSTKNNEIFSTTKSKPADNDDIVFFN